MPFQTCLRAPFSSLALYGTAGIQMGPRTPSGVYARVVDGRTLYVNTTEHVQKIAIPGSQKGLITHRVYKHAIVLGPWEGDLVE